MNVFKECKQMLTIKQLSGLTATALFGLMAGFFATYSFNVNYAMLAVDASTYAEVQSLFNINVRHTGFFLCFFGAGALPYFCAVLNIKNKSIFYFWLLLGTLYLTGIILFTKLVNLPLNYYTESWTPSTLPSDWENTRDAWNQANLFRFLLSFILFISALVLLIKQDKTNS